LERKKLGRWEAMEFGIEHAECGSGKVTKVI
jgi:hypothetical protein